MALPYSKTQIEKLGARLLSSDHPEPADLAMLHTLLGVYGDVLTVAVERVRVGVDVVPTARVKNTGTILEKLERHGGSWLKSIQDLAGMRIVADVDACGQDVLVQQVADIFADDAKPPRIIDRRQTPSCGYTAVHVVVFPQGVPVEIQLRTRLQHEWAEMFEKLADKLGRGIRYGNPPDHWLPVDERDGELYLASFREREAIVMLAIAFGNYIAVVEAQGLDEHRAKIVDVLAELRVHIREYADRPGVR